MEHVGEVALAREADFESYVGDRSICLRIRHYIVLLPLAMPGNGFDNLLRRVAPAQSALGIGPIEFRL